MQIINLPRFGGKTNALLALMTTDSRIVYVAPTRQQAGNVYGHVMRTQEKYPEAMRVEKRYISVWQALEKKGVHNEVLVIDELDSVLNSIFRLPTAAAALTATDGSGVCRCGNDVDKHNPYTDNHSPVERYLPPEPVSAELVKELHAWALVMAEEYEMSSEVLLTEFRRFLTDGAFDAMKEAVTKNGGWNADGSPRV